MTLKAIIGEAVKAGACVAGFAPVRPDGADRQLYEHWLRRGFHGTMEYMERGAEGRFNPGLVLEGAKSALVAAFPYGPAGGEPRHRLISDYALGEDYHTTLRRRLAPVAAAMERLAPGSRTRICIDSAPVRERTLAVAAGIGGCGLNGMLLVPGVGAQVFLAEILWTKEVETQTLEPSNPCTGCGSCLRACPTGALRGDGSVDARRCLAYLTIEYGGDLPGAAPEGAKIFGCDCCSRVCPVGGGLAPLPEFRQSPAVAALDEEAVGRMGSATFRRLATGSALGRISAGRLKRNLKWLKGDGI